MWQSEIAVEDARTLALLPVGIGIALGIQFLSIATIGLGIRTTKYKCGLCGGTHGLKEVEFFGSKFYVCNKHGRPQ